MFSSFIPTRLRLRLTCALPERTTSKASVQLSVQVRFSRRNKGVCCHLSSPRSFLCQIQQLFCFVSSSSAEPGVESFTEAITSKPRGVLNHKAAAAFPFQTLFVDCSFLQICAVLFFVKNVCCNTPVFPLNHTRCAHEATPESEMRRSCSQPLQRVCQVYFLKEELLCV